MDESLRLSESITLDSFKAFYRAFIARFADIYLRSPTPDDTTPDESISIEALFARIGFPACLSCLNCSG